MMYAQEVTVLWHGCAYSSVSAGQRETGGVGYNRAVENNWAKCKCALNVAFHFKCKEEEYNLCFWYHTYILAFD